MPDVVLVSMPFGPLFTPSLGLTLLKGALARQGVAARLDYFTIRFAEAVGHALYTSIGEGQRPALQDLTGEWLFSRALFDTTDADDEQYVVELLRDYYPDALVRRLARARRLVDGFLDECAATVLRDEPRLVGFTSVFQQHTASLALARRLKRLRPSLFILFGGANCEGIMGAETVRSFPFVDAAVSGEGDLVLSELVDRVLSGQSLAALRGVRSRDSVEAEFAAGRFENAPSVIDMDALPYPDYRDYFRQFRASRFHRGYLPAVLLETSRGCWWGERMHCTFCGLNADTMAFRSKSAARALDEVAALTRRHRGSDVEVVDNILDLRYFKEFIPALAARRLKTTFFYETKSNLNRNQVRLLRDARVLRIQPGIESFSDGVLKLMRKGVSGLQNIQLLKWCREFGIRPSWNVLWGFPGESPDEYRRMAELAPLLVHLPAPHACDAIRLDRFSPNFCAADRLGFRDVQPFTAYRHVYPALSAPAVGNLACYFRYQYAEPRVVDEYVRPLARQIDRWKRARHADLFCCESEDYLVVVDLRQAGEGALTVLGGIERRLYRECDAVKGLLELTQAAGGSGADAAGQVEVLLAPLVARGLLLRDGSRYLALAILQGEYAPPVASMRALARLGRVSGRRNGSGWVVPATHIEGGQQARTMCHVLIGPRGRLVIEASEHPWAEATERRWQRKRSGRTPGTPVEKRRRAPARRSGR